MKGPVMAYIYQILTLLPKNRLLLSMLLTIFIHESDKDRTVYHILSPIKKWHARAENMTMPTVLLESTGQVDYVPMSTL